MDTSAFIKYWLCKRKWDVLVICPSGCCFPALVLRRRLRDIIKIVAAIVKMSPSLFQMRTMSDETEQRMCEEDFGSDEEGEEADVESYLEDNSGELMDRLRELEVRKQDEMKCFCKHCCTLSTIFCCSHRQRILL